MSIELRVEVTSGPEHSYCFDHAEVTVGGHPFNEVVISLPGIAARHGRFYMVDGALFYEDLHSVQGSTLLRSGAKAVALRGAKAALEVGDQIVLGGKLARLTLVSFSHREHPDLEVIAWSDEQLRPSELLHQLPHDLQVPTLEAASDLLACCCLASAAQVLGALAARAVSCVHASLSMVWGERQVIGQCASCNRKGSRCAGLVAPLGPAVAPPRHLTLHPITTPDPDLTQTWEVRCLITLPANPCPQDSTPKPAATADTAGTADTADTAGTAGAISACVLHLVCTARPTTAQLSVWATALTYCAPHMQSLLAREVSARQCAQLKEENQYFHTYFHRHYLIKTLAFESPAMRAMRESFEALLHQTTPALISGEAGSGKQLYARALHYMGSRASNLFVALSCAEASGRNLDLDLFGEVPSRRGLLEMLDGGTLFLDDIDRLSLPLQGKLVRVLNEGEARRYGDEAARAVDVRVLAASHHPLLGLVERGLFRRDLFATLSSATLHIPPLRDRPEDILPLAEGFRRTFAHRYGLQVDALDSSAQSRLISYTWPGNVRELQVVIETAVMKAQHGPISAAHLNLRSD